MKTKRCKSPLKECKRQVNQQEWKNSFEKSVCMTCLVRMRGILEIMLDNGALTPREEKIFDMRFGFIENRQTHTLEEVGREFGVTRERIRQIESRVMEKIRKVDNSLDK